MNTMHRYNFCSIIVHSNSADLYKEVLGNERYSELAAVSDYSVAYAVAEKLRDFDIDELNSLAKFYGISTKICA